MNKIFSTILILVTISNLCVIGQVNVDSGKNGALPNDTNDVEMIKLNAEKWFKDVYVENFFTDPYSYRMVGLKAIPITNEDFFKNELILVQEEIDNTTLAEVDRSDEALIDMKRILSNGEKNIEDLREQIKTEGDEKGYLTKKLNVYIEYQKKFLDLNAKMEIYHLAINTKREVLEILSNMTEEQSNELRFYDIRLDCYSKNKLGNEVLGRFSFPFTENGVLGDNNGVDKVKKLND